MIRDPKIDARAERFLAGRPRQQYSEATPEQLQAQLNGVADMLVGVVKERDQYIAASATAASAKLWSKILTVCVLVEAGMIAWFANQLFARLH